jgi:hypothetical protein
MLAFVCFSSSQFYENQDRPPIRMRLNIAKSATTAQCRILLYECITASMATPPQQPYDALVYLQAVLAPIPAECQIFDRLVHICKPIQPLNDLSASYHAILYVFSTPRASALVRLHPRRSRPMDLVQLLRDRDQPSVQSVQRWSGAYSDLPRAVPIGHSWRNVHEMIATWIHPTFQAGTE